LIYPAGLIVQPDNAPHDLLGGHRRGRRQAEGSFLFQAPRIEPNFGLAWLICANPELIATQLRWRFLDFVHDTISSIE
jgi:hypothetical protein